VHPPSGHRTPAPPDTFTPTAGRWDTTGMTVSFGTAGDPNALVQFAGNPRVAATSQDGSPIRELQSFSSAQDGMVTGVFSNGRTKALAQLAITNFNNPAGLDKVGGTMFRATVNSGLP